MVFLGTRWNKFGKRIYVVSHDGRLLLEWDYYCCTTDRRRIHIDFSEPCSPETTRLIEIICPRIDTGSRYRLSRRLLPTSDQETVPDYYELADKGCWLTFDDIEEILQTA